MTASRSHRARLGALLLLIVFAVVGLVANPAYGATAGVSSYRVEANVDSNGVLTVNATLQVEGSPTEVQQRFATTMDRGRDQQYRFTLGDWKASVGGTEITPTVETDGTYQVLTIPLNGSQGPVTFSYSVRGAALDTGDKTTTLRWRLLQGLNLPVRSFDATVSAPGTFTFIDCAAGSPVNPGVCGYTAGGTHEQRDPVFHDGPRGAGEVVDISIRFDQRVVKPNESVHQVWTLDRAFSVAPVPLGVAAGALVLGSVVLWLLHRKFGADADAHAEPMLIARFEPAGRGESEFEVDAEIRPGLVGTLIDEVVDPVDITASLLDLAIRGHLHIEELPRTSTYQGTQWAITRQDSDDPLHDYEKILLDAIADAGDGHATVAEIAQAVGGAIPQVQSAMYDEVVDQGWFAHRPDETRNAWTTLGWVKLIASVVITVALVAFTTFGLFGLVLIGLSIVLILLAQQMPARTPKGASVLAGLQMLRVLLITQPTNQMPVGRELAELSKVLPYAVVLGGTDRWLDGLVAADDDDTADSTDLDWYHAPDDWHLSDLPASLKNFVTTVEGEFFKR